MDPETGLSRTNARSNKQQRDALDLWVRGKMRKRAPFGMKIDVATDKPYSSDDLAKMASRKFNRVISEGQIRSSFQRLHETRTCPRLPPPSPALDGHLPQVPEEPFERTPWDVLLDRVEALEAHGHTQARLIRHLYARLGEPVPE